MPMLSFTASYSGLEVLYCLDYCSSQRYFKEVPLNFSESLRAFILLYVLCRWCLCHDKDPDGDTVFNAHNKTLEIHTVTNFLATERSATESDIETLKQRIEQLENQLKELMVKCYDFSSIID